MCHPDYTIVSQPTTLSQTCLMYPAEIKTRLKRIKLIIKLVLLQINEKPGISGVHILQLVSAFNSNDAMSGNTDTD